MATPPTLSHVILDNASLQLGPGPASTGLTELACYANHVELSPDVSTTTLDTFCGSTDYPGVVKWSLITTLYQSFDTPGGTEAVLEPLVEAGDPCTFLIYAYRDKPIGPDNPAWTGTVVPQPYAPLNGDAGDASEVDIEWSLIGAPTKLVAPPT
ncbi:MAG TPA: hypothetical protein VKB57_23600 [Acidimicrobiales bacterium]|nr:hypothetical protein [Acidimicrobiales bacterium]